MKARAQGKPKKGFQFTSQVGKQAVFVRRQQLLRIAGLESLPQTARVTLVSLPSDVQVRQIKSAAVFRHRAFLAPKRVLTIVDETGVTAMRVVLTKPQLNMLRREAQIAAKAIGTSDAFDEESYIELQMLPDDRATHKRCKSSKPNKGWVIPGGETTPKPPKSHRSKFHKGKR